MNRETGALRKRIAEGIFERRLPSLAEFWGTVSQVPAVYLDAFWQDALDEADQILQALIEELRGITTVKVKDNLKRLTG